MVGFVFYDVETTGTDSAFDQILQFAAIHVDADLNVLGHFNRHCRLLPHIIPSPKALTVSGMNMARLLDPSLPVHYDMVCEVAAQLNAWSPAIFLGWHSLGFDEHFLRQALYQCLHPPYITNTVGSSRCDLMKLAQALIVLQPDALAPAYDATGQRTFNLTAVAQANGIQHSNPHDALADAEVTLALCRLIRDRAPDHWSTVLRFAQKSAAAAFIDEASAFIATECYFGWPYQYALAKIGVAAEQPSTTILAYNLEVDPAALRQLSDAQLRERLGQRVKPVRRLKLNAAPILHDVYDLDDFDGVSADQWIARAEEVHADTELCQRLCRAAEREPFPIPDYVESKIYGGMFSGDADKARMAAFHAGNWETRAAMVEKFEDTRLVELGHRLLFHNAPHLLAQERRREIERSLARRVLGYGFAQTPWLTLGRADTEAEELCMVCEPEHLELITGLRGYLAQQHQLQSALIG